MDGYKSSHEVAWIQTPVFMIEQQLFLTAVSSLQLQVKEPAIANFNVIEKDQMSSPTYVLSSRKALELKGKVS